MLFVDERITALAPEGGDPSVEGRVVEGPDHHSHRSEHPRVGQGQDLEVAQVAGHVDDAASRGHGRLDVLAPHDLDERKNVFTRTAL